ncbi:MAG: DUF721 domain-containing protein [Snodgrassella sp.]|uniref:DciA family protein n=1 Tax=Snodgrassella TaxID=1193515 RepID=UPI00081621F0|nr:MULTISPECIES: DciA family protein [Snodgrassella]MCO6521804.1 DUF721 domain-containing protein [Snodgrassella sp.]SCC14108.1 Protein of unknown function [Snodgrassella sp. R-53583]
MNLNRFGKKNAQLNQLLTQSAHWQRLSTCLKQELPASMRAHFNVACVRDGCLVVIAHNSMAASRLRMVLPALLPQLQQIEATINSVKVKVQPPESKPEAVKRASLSPVARGALARSAQALPHHPELAAALRRLSEKNS